MDIKCPQCGAAVKEDDLFCPKCGGKVNEEYDEPLHDNNEISTNTEINALSSKRFSPLALLIAAASIAIIIIILIIVLAGKPYEKPVKNMLDSVIKNNYKLYLSSVPEYYTNQKSSLAWKKTVDELNTSLLEVYGQSAKFKYKIKGSEKLDDDEIESLEKAFNSRIRAANEEISYIKIKKGYEINVRIVSEGRRNDGVTNVSFYVLKVNGKWKVCEIDGSGDYFNIFTEVAFLHMKIKY